MVTFRMKEKATNHEFDRFHTGAAKYAAYLETPDGRLRLDLAFANLQDILGPSESSLRAVDIGCGTGAIAVRLAELGLHVTLLDASAAMLDLAKLAAREAEVTDRIVLKHGDAAQFATLFPNESFDVILCHNLLEYVDDPSAVLRSLARALRDSSSILSILVRNQAGEILKAAIRDGDLVAAEKNLVAEWGHESLYGGSVRLFTEKSLCAMLIEASLVSAAVRGVRVISDYLPSTVSRSDEYKRILGLERKLGSRPEFGAVARYIHCVARRPDTIPKGV